MNKIQHGLNILSKDKRDIRLGQVMDLPHPLSLPSKFSLGDSPILDQNADGNSDLCGAYATSAGCRFEDGVDFHPPFVFAAAKQGDEESFGLELRTLMSAWCDIGCMPASLVNDDLRALTPDQRRYFKNYTNPMKAAAAIYKKRTYVSALDSNMEPYDSIRQAIYANRDKKQAVYFGLTWHWNLSDYILEGIGDYGSGHCMFVKGWDDDGLEVQNSAGLSAGVNGIHRVSRLVINRYAPMYGAYMLIDMPLEEARALVLARQEKELGFIARILALLTELWHGKPIIKPAPVPPPVLVVKTEPVIFSDDGKNAPPSDIEAPKYLWATKASARHSCRVIMDEAGLQWSDKELLCKIINAESSFNATALNENKDKKGNVLSVDYGICQINSYYNIGPGKPFASKEEVISEPEKSVRFMIAMLKAGKLNLWSSYKSGAYLNFTS